MQCAPSNCLDRYFGGIVPNLPYAFLIVRRCPEEKIMDGFAVNQELAHFLIHGRRLVQTQMALSPGDKLGPYKILALVGKGDMGEVYRAHDDRPRRT